jgi:acetylornithine deacetylase/succinyl-diaminopimelate desuccinylase-like protein
VKDNAIYHLAAGLTRLSQHNFPIQLNDTTRSYFDRMAAIQGGEIGTAMKALAANPADANAAELVTANPTWNAMVRTTCIATLLEAGHATNALPQRARANVNCRIFPSVAVDDVRRTLEQIVADPAITVTALKTRAPIAPPPELKPAIMGPIENLAAEFYGLGMFLDADFGNIHGLNERIRVNSVYDGRDFLHALVKTYASEAR